MAVSCGIYLRERGNIGNSKRLPGVTEWEFWLLRNQGCGALTFAALMSEAEWLTYEPYCAIDELAHVYFNMNDTAEHRSWSGTLEDVPDPSATPPARTHRRFRARPTWAGLENPGARALYVYEDDSVNTIVKSLATLFAAPQTTVSSSTTEIIAGTSYTIAQAILEDKLLGPTIKKLAEINQATVYGVNGANDKVYFKDETAASISPAYTFRMGTHADGVVKFTRKQRRGNRANAFIVEGRDARSGNPMIIVAYDSALDSHADAIWRWKRLRAPELVSGPDIKRWAEWLVAKEKDPLEEGTLEIAGIDTFLTSGAIRDLNVNVQVQDEGGVPLLYQNTHEQWPLQSIAYRMTNAGSYDATLKMGNALPIDAMDELGVRELLQELAVFAAKEFSNQIEVQAEDDPWPVEVYITFLAQNQMRNNIRARLDNRLDFIDLEATDPNEGHLLCTNLKSNYDGGLTGDGGGDTIGQFVTTAIGVGASYDTWALLRRLTYPVLIEGEVGAGIGSQFYEPFAYAGIPHNTYGFTPNWTMSDTETSDGLNTFNQQHIVPAKGHVRVGDEGEPVDGFLLHNVPLTFSTEIIYEFWWGTPSATDDDDRYLVFSFQDRDNYHFIHMERGSGGVDLRFRFGKVIDGTLTWSPEGTSGIWAGTSGNGDLIRATLYLYTPGEWMRVRFENLNEGYSNEQIQQAGWWNPSAGMVYAGFRWTCPDSYDMPGGYEPWRIKKMTFSGTNEAFQWYISRDGRETWEGPLNANSGTPVLLGDYAGGAEEGVDIYIKGFVAYPQILTGIAAGWKDA